MTDRFGFPDRFGVRPDDEVWAHGTAVYAGDTDPPALLCECASEYTAQLIAALFRYYIYHETVFAYGPRRPQLRVVK